LSAAARHRSLSEREREELWEKGARHIRHLERKRLDGILCWITGKNTDRFSLYQKVHAAQMRHFLEFSAAIRNLNGNVIIHKGLEFTESLFNGESICLHGDIDALCDASISNSVVRELGISSFKPASCDVKNGCLANPLDGDAPLENNFNIGSFSKMVDIELTPEEMASIGRWVRPVWTDLRVAKVVITFDIATGLDANINAKEVLENSVSSVGLLRDEKTMALVDRIWYTLSLIGHSLISTGELGRGSKLAEAVLLIQNNYDLLDWEAIGDRVEKHQVAPVFIPMLELICEVCDLGYPGSLMRRRSLPGVSAETTKKLFTAISH
ncbi:hypothetical protein, partial [Polaromonas sp. P5_E6]